MGTLIENYFSWAVVLFLISMTISVIGISNACGYTVKPLTTIVLAICEGLSGFVLLGICVGIVNFAIIILALMGRFDCVPGNVQVVINYMSLGVSVGTYLASYKHISKSIAVQSLLVIVCYGCSMIYLDITELSKVNPYLYEKYEKHTISKLTTFEKLKLYSKIRKLDKENEKKTNIVDLLVQQYKETNSIE